MNKYFKTWKQLANCAISSYLSNRIDSTCYFIGKVVRFAFFLFLILAIFKYKSEIAGYGKYEAMLFYFTFNLVDVLSQSLFRGVYMFKGDISQGDFDYILSKPVNPLFYIMLRVTDILDIIFLIPIILSIVYAAAKLPQPLAPVMIIGYIAMIFIGMLVIFGIHVLSAAITVVTVENDNFIWFYRELINTGRFPPEIYSPTLQFILTYFMPIIVMIAFPVKALLGAANPAVFLQAALIAAVFSISSLIFWRAALKRYSSASS